MKDGGVLFHAKHAYMPNALGYCGPDDRGRILRSLEEGTGGEDLLAVLKGFEAAYPFLRLISKSAGKDVFDYSVPEAYWIGNSLLEGVRAADFYAFSHRELEGRSPSEVRHVFRGLNGRGRPHHTFHVMSTYASSSVADGPNLSNAGSRKVGKLIDDCRVSWGRVTKVGDKDLEVLYRPVVLAGGRLALGRQVAKKVAYNRDVSPFPRVKPGSWVSLHWDYACEVLTKRQVANVRRYTEWDIGAVNGLLSNAET